jgi:hypothetical protein
LRGPDTDPNTTAEIARAIREGRSFTCEIVNYRLNGERFWNRLTIYPFGGKPGKPDFYVGNQVDITNTRSLAKGTVDKLASGKISIDYAAQQANQAMILIKDLQQNQKNSSITQQDFEKFFFAENEALSAILAELEVLAHSVNNPDPEDSVGI